MDEFKVGDSVKIIDGDYKGFYGYIALIDGNKAVIQRDTELGVNQATCNINDIALN